MDRMTICQIVPQENKLFDDMEIYRYFQYDKLTILLKEKALWFSNTGEFYDKKERQIPRGLCYNFSSRESSDHYIKSTEVKKHYCQSYVSCWSKVRDGYAHWKVYTPCGNGCMLATTIGKIKSQLSEQFSREFALYEVEYLDDITKKNITQVVFSGTEMPTSIVALEKYKITSYKYEEEVRFVFYSNNYENGYPIPIDISKMFNYAIISPFAMENKEKEIAQKLRSSMSIEILDSNIREKENKGKIHDWFPN